MGESKKKRMCPALGRAITTVECGGGRGTRIACPAACPHNPFSPERYAQVLAIEDGLSPKVLRRLADELGAALPAPARNKDEGAAVFTRMTLARFFDRDAAGQTFAARWRAAGYAGLTNDERVIFEGQAQMRLVLLEIQRVGAEKCEGQDRLDLTAAPMVIHDRALAGEVVRFTSLLGWAFPQPHYWRMHGMAMPIPECHGMEPEAVVRAVVRHLGGPVAMPDLRLWLQDNFARMHAALSALEEGLQQRMFAGMDVRFHTAVYRLLTPAAELERRLAALPALVPDEASADERKEGYTRAWTWLDEAAPQKAGALAVARTLGGVALGPEHICLRGGMDGRFAKLRAAFERWFGRDVVLVGERTEDVSRQMLQRHPPQFDPALVPPELLVHAPHFELNVSRVRVENEGVTDLKGTVEEQVMRANLATYADQAIPHLDGRTPREAAHDPALRPKLVAMMKHFVRKHDKACRNLRQNVDINGLLRDLGLTELDFPPPPLPIATDDDDDDDETAAFAPVAAHDPRPAAPALLAAPLSEQEALDRFERFARTAADPGVLLANCDAASAGLLDFLTAFTDGWHEEDRLCLLVAAAYVWFALNPPEYRPRTLDYDQLDEAIERAFDDLDAAHAAGHARALPKFLDAVSQPAVFACANIFVTRGANRVKGERLLSKMETMAILSALVNTVDATPP